jgi:pyrimidine operon attenuation protein/uracil phosphoribosyltransferase
MIKLGTVLKLQRQIRILKHANNDLESELALQKEYNGSNLRRIDRLEKENTELVRKLMDKGHFILFAIPKRQTYLADRLQPIIETREPVITNDIKVSVFDDLMAKGFIRKNREDDNFVMYELGLKTE